MCFIVTDNAVSVLGGGLAEHGLVSHRKDCPVPPARHRLTLQVERHCRRGSAGPVPQIN